MIVTLTGYLGKVSEYWEQDGTCLRMDTLMSDKKVDWATFFSEHEDYRVEMHFHETRRSFTMEELYQAFKARMRFEEDHGY